MALKTRGQALVDPETRRLLDAAAAREGRSPAAVLKDAIRLYVHSQGDEYRRYWDVAGKYLDAPPESDERALLGAELDGAIAAPGGAHAALRGGEVAAVRARLRQRQVIPAATP